MLHAKCTRLSAFTSTSFQNFLCEHQITKSITCSRKSWSRFVRPPQVDMALDGYKDVTNVDYSPVVIQQLRQAHGTTWPALRYAVADCRSMPQYTEGSFAGVLDKGGRRKGAAAWLARKLEATL